ncbi:DUF3005 domain-containing protein [Paraburkholderia tagetis]|uniref:DUF3005 domain-containing protein n=1 Tax=Paraburkholderia tagetis TaxID=2913261 RepID=A0A9X1UEN8_9BURK|nr:DUF3005 domain-containing protein [Paraburkholderia tagetis]MCG5073405.1 DUF3005 domain-containing protein [Paraburkholderia tagetis]
MNDSDRSNRTAGTQGKELRPRSAELHNDRTHDSTVDTDGKNREAARLAGHGPIGPDEVTTSNASLDNSMPETPDGLAGFDSRGYAHRMPFAPGTGFEAVDMGMADPQTDDAERQFDDQREPGQRRSPGRIHYAMNHMRPTRVVELHRKH